MRLDNVFYVPELKPNILSLGQFDEHGCRILMEGDFLTIYGQCGRLLVKVKKTLSMLYLLKLNLVLSCMVANDSSENLDVTYKVWTFKLSIIKEIIL